MADEVVHEDASDGAHWVTPGRPPHLGYDFVAGVPLGWAISVQPVEGGENLCAAGRPSANPVGEREIKGLGGQPFVSEECGQLRHEDIPCIRFP
jgi:hypothetical protein